MIVRTKDFYYKIVQSIPCKTSKKLNFFYDVISLNIKHIFFRVHLESRVHLPVSNVYPFLVD